MGRKCNVLGVISVVLCALALLFYSSFGSSSSTMKMCSSISSCVTSLQSSLFFVGGGDVNKSTVDSRNTEDDWRKCIIQMGNHVAMGTSEWIQNNSCGFESRATPESMKTMLFPQDDPSETTILFFGDSLSQQTFITEVNTFYPPNYFFRNKKSRKAWAPRVPIFTLYNTTSTPPPPSSTAPLTTQRRSHIVYKTAQYLHAEYNALMEEIERLCKVPTPTTHSNMYPRLTSPTTLPPPPSQSLVPNIIFMSFGNWDMSWKVGGRHVPGLVPVGVDASNVTMEDVKVFWAKEADRLFMGVDAGLNKCRSRGGTPPFLVLREQYMPTCKAKRFAKSPWTNCTGLLVPLLVPFQRRMLAATAWSFNVPVMPSEHMFTNESGCELYDGLHVGDAICRMLEHQQHLETYRLLRNNNVVQGRLPGLPPLNTTVFVNVEKFYKHLDLVGVGRYYQGQTYPVNYGVTNKEL